MIYMCVFISGCLWSEVLYGFSGRQSVLDRFDLQLLSQNWINDEPDEGRDFCSHGAILIKVNDRVISDESFGDWTVAASALRLMKSAIYGYDSEDELEMIPHCGYLRVFPSCPNNITWDTEVYGDLVLISNIQVSANDGKGIQVISGSFRIDRCEYVDQVLRFAQEIRSFYERHIPRKFENTYDEEEYELYWKEFKEYHRTLSGTKGFAGIPFLLSTM